MGLCYGRPAPALAVDPVQDEVDKDNNTSDVEGPTPKRPSTPKLPKFPFYLPSPLPASSYKPIGRILKQIGRYGADIGPHSVRCPSDALLSPLSNSMLEQEKDWTGLPPELIQIIAKKLPDLLDFIRFRATCKAWRSSAPLSNPPPQLPWFAELTVEEFDGNCTWKTQRFYSVSSCQTLTIRLTQSMSQCCFVMGAFSYNPIHYLPFLLTNNRWWHVKGAFSHYLPFHDLCKGTLSFFNPLTKDEFSISWPHSVPRHYPWMIWTGTDPIRNRSIVVVNLGGWACYDPHSNKWVEQQGIVRYSCYWQGMFFSTDVASVVTEVFDASSKKLLHNIPPPEDEVTKSVEFYNNNPYSSREPYLVESLGTILMVSWFYNMGRECIVEDSIFYIYRLEFDGLDGQPCWVRVHNIGNQILFLHEMAGFSMTATPSTGFREGCIYFLCHLKPYVYDILAGTTERMPCPFERCTWFLPGLC